MIVARRLFGTSTAKLACATRNTTSPSARQIGQTCSVVAAEEGGQRLKLHRLPDRQSRERDRYVGDDNAKAKELLHGVVDGKVVIRQLAAQRCNRSPTAQRGIAVRIGIVGIDSYLDDWNRRMIGIVAGDKVRRDIDDVARAIGPRQLGGGIAIEPAATPESATERPPRIDGTATQPDHNVHRSAPQSWVPYMIFSAREGVQASSVRSYRDWQGLSLIMKIRQLP